MNIQQLRKDRQKWMNWKNIKPLREALDNLKNVKCDVEFSDTIKIDSKDGYDIEKTAKLMMPWRKGPFEIFDTFIDTEWKSNIKYNLLRPYFNLHD